MHVGFDMDERTFLRMQRGFGKTKGKLVGATVEFGLANEDNFSHRATVDFVGNEFDPRTGTIHIRALVSDAKGVFLPGLFVRVRLPVGEQQPLLLLPDGVQTKPGQMRVLIVSDQNVVESRDLTLAPGSVSVLTAGLKPTDWVIVAGDKDLEPGMRVQVERTPTPAQVKAPRQSKE
jgi:multidrug efflux pump subunit AcrA (membrane-fusion protein)